MGQETEAGTRRSLFWRLWFRALTVKRPQAALAAGSLLAGAAVMSMLLNLYADVRRKMTQEFRAYGANVVLAPATGQSATANGTGLMDESVLAALDPLRQRTPGLTAVPVLYLVTELVSVPARQDPMATRLPDSVNVVAVGADFAGLHQMNSGWRVEGKEGNEGPDNLQTGDQATCAIGAHLASTLHLAPGDAVRLVPVSSVAGGSGSIVGGSSAGKRTPDREVEFKIGAVLSTGASEDDQVFVPLPALQRLAGLDGKLSLVELSVPGEAAGVEQAIREISRSLPGLEVRPIRQIVYSEGKVLATIRGVLISLTALILGIIMLCVMATMTTIVLERRKDIGMMKALGASDGLVMRLFMTEGAGLGLVGGLAGSLMGAEWARRLGRQLFGVSLELAWWTLPAIAGASMLLALVATAFPVRIVRNVQPAVALKGE